jgi:macrodomain Ter protein organizer (MatP/YcbG family)
MKTTLQASISIEAAAWNRVRSLAARRHRSLPDVIGDLLDEASAESEPDVPKVDEQYEAPPLLRLFLRRHPEVRPHED